MPNNDEEVKKAARQAEELIARLQRLPDPIGVYQWLAFASHSCCRPSTVRLHRAVVRAFKKRKLKLTFQELFGVNCPQAHICMQ